MRPNSRHFVLIFLLCSVVSSAQQIAKASDPNADWHAFRKSYPYHIQEVVLAEPVDGQQTLIIAEPPPQTSFAGLKQLDAVAFSSPLVGTHRVGYDGWVKDIIVTFPVRTPAQMQALIDKLHIYLFGTAYKSYALKISREPVIQKTKLNIRISASDLNKWLFLEKEQFRPSFGSAHLSIRDALTAGRSGLYYSETPGLVALVVSRKTMLSAMNRELRRFALDSDLILGATASPSHVAILARERVQPVESLPPLRTETILLLANAKTNQLAQSYERMNLFAGRVKQIQMDWAPIYLSDDLIDTEYGSLLNITDQMLKSWSSDGQVRYTNFDYQDPHNWPFAKPILIDAHLSEVTFNWNTKGAGYTLDLNGHHILALNRTGSLPISYIPGEIDPTGKNPLARYEETAYDYFSGLQDPNLARVVQYALLYQVFREYGIQDNSRPVPQYEHPECNMLSQVAENMIQDLMRHDPEWLAARANDSEATVTEKRKLNEELTKFRSALNRGTSLYGSEFISDVAARLANPRVDEPLEQAIQNGSRSRASLTASEKRGMVAGEFAYQFGKMDLGRYFAGRIGRSNETALYKDYAEKAALRRSVWIHTPSVVISKTQGELATMVGGHNLDARVIRFRVSDQVVKGDIRIVEEASGRVVLVNPRDSGAIPELLRTTALAPSKADLAATVKPILARHVEVPSNLPRAQVLGFERTAAADTRGLSTAQIHAPALGGWSSLERTTAEINPAHALSKAGVRAMTVKKNADFTFAVYAPDATGMMEARSYDAAMDAVVSAMKNADGPAGS